MEFTDKEIKTLRAILIEREIELNYKYLAALRVKAESQGMFSPIWEQISDIYVEIRELKEELEELI